MDNTGGAITSLQWGSTIDGGVVQFSSGTGFGALSLWGTVNWNGGTLNMRVDGRLGQTQQNPNSDRIYGDQFNSAQGATGPTLNVTSQTSPPIQNRRWTLISAQNAISNRFPRENIVGLGAEIVNNLSLQVFS